MRIGESDVPGGVRLSVPRGGQGQALEWSFGDVGQRSEGSPGDRYACCEDRSVPSVTYYRLVSR